MPSYVIGDVQGCFDELMLLLEKINFNSKNDELIFAGDLINRGPKSLEVLEFCLKNKKSIEVVLGNHDIYLLYLIHQNKKEVAKRIVSILDELQVSYDNKDLVTIINAGYPDIRRVLNSCQRQVIDGKLKIDDTSVIQANYMTKLVEILKSDNKKDAFKNIRQLINDSKVKDFSALHKYLFDEIDSYATGHIASVILILAESQYQDSFAVDKELHIMSTIVKLLNELK